jgi:hypothetical protein
VPEVWAEVRVALPVKRARRAIFFRREVMMIVMCEVQER